MKISLSLLFLLNLAVPSYAQKGFKIIHKAEKKHEKGQDLKALKLLSKAEDLNYGFCGNAWMEAERAINLLRAEIYINQKNYQSARNSLDSIGWEYKRDNLDSIRIRTYQMEFGKDSLSKMIETSMSSANVNCSEFDCYVIIPLNNGREVKLKPNPLSNINLFLMDDEKKKAERWLKIFQDSNNYKLIKERSK